MKYLFFLTDYIKLIYKKIFYIIKGYRMKVPDPSYHRLGKQVT